jgi:hypothetical protein
MTLSIMTLSIKGLYVALSIKGLYVAFSIKGLYVALSINDIQRNNALPFMLSVAFS